LQKINELSLDFNDHPSYWPDLAPSDYILPISKAQRILTSEKKFPSNEIAAIVAKQCFAQYLSM
jgi:hypothetical protein